MKKFIVKIAVFSGVSLSLLVSCTTFLYFSVVQQANFKLKANTKYVVVGHSHPECAFNDRIIPDFENLASSGESYFYTYFKIKEVLRQNPQIQTVFVEFTNNQIALNKNEWIWGEEFITNRYPDYAPFMNKEDHLLLLRNNFSGYLNSFSLSLNVQIERLAKRNYNFRGKMGGYRDVKKSAADSLIRILDVSQKAVEPDSPEVSEANLVYLEKIVKLGKGMGKQVLLIRSPQHGLYRGYNNEEIYTAIRKNRFGDMDFLDFSEFPLSNTEYGDLEHLNVKGAKIFSLWFQSLLEEGFVERPDKQEYIQKRIERKTTLVKAS